VPSNIAEGCGRQHTKDVVNFLYIARGSLYELETQLYLSFDQRFMSAEKLDHVLEQITECKKLLHGFINHHKAKLSD
jgi:four helix bundle protein